MSLVELDISDSRTDGDAVSTTADPDVAVGLPSAIAPETKVEVRSRFDSRWAPGFEVIDLEDAGYRIRRLSDGAELPSRFSRDEIRRERRRGQWWY